MQPKPQVILNSWRIVTGRLKGKVESHPTVEDGEQVTTTSILKRPMNPNKGDIIETKNTMYLLGEKA